MIGVVVVAVVVASAIWVYLDATKNKIGKVPGAGGMFNMSAGAWATVTLLLWIIGFPAYLIKRGSLIERAKSHPVEVGGRGAKTAVLGVVGGLWVFMTFSGAALSSLPTCGSSNAAALVGQIVEDMPVVKAAGVKYVTLKEVEEQGFNENAQIRSCAATLVTTAGEDSVQYSIKWNDKAKGEFYVEAQIL